MTELEYVIKHRGLAPKRVLGQMTRRGFGASVLGAAGGYAASRLVGPPRVEAATAGADFTIAIIPDPQNLPGGCPSTPTPEINSFYLGLMNWILTNKNLTLNNSGTSPSSYSANIKAVVGVGDCVSNTTSESGIELPRVAAAWGILDTAGMPYVTPPGNHDYNNSGNASDRTTLGNHFASGGYFSSGTRAGVYGSGMHLGGGDMAYWAGSFDATGANTAVIFSISGIAMLFLSMDFFAGTAAWSWAYDIMLANPRCEVYITTHCWLTMTGAQCTRTAAAGPNVYSMAAAPYSNATTEAWSTIGVNAWPNLFGCFGGHDLDPYATPPGWYWQQVPIVSSSVRGQTVQQLFMNSQQIDQIGVNGIGCSDLPPSTASLVTGEGQVASLFLLTRRPALGLLEGRMLSTVSGNWFAAEASGFPSSGNSWSVTETVLFSVPFTGLSGVSAPFSSPTGGVSVTGAVTIR